MAYQPLDQNITDFTNKRHTKETGWGLYASKDIAAGQKIISILRPLVISLDIPRLKDTCYSCLNYTNEVHHAIRSLAWHEDRKLQICTGCHVVRYCSKECQSDSWKTVHKHECDLFARLHPNILPNNVRAIIQLLLLGRANKLPRGEWNSFMQLESHLQEYQSAGGQSWENIGLMARGAKEYSGINIDESTLREAFCRLLVNCFTMIGLCHDPIGLVLHPLPALINHSCNYNAVIDFNTLWRRTTTHAMNIIALRPIAKDEEIFVSYIDSTNPDHIRQNELQARYFFTCKCSLCSNRIAKPESLTFVPYSGDHLALEQRAFELLASARKDTSITGPILKLRYGIHILRKTDSWPLHRQPLASLRHELIISLIAAQQYHLAFLHSWIQFRHIDLKIYPEKHHPLRLIHQYLIVALIKHIDVPDALQQERNNLPPQEFNLFAHAPGGIRPNIDLRIIRRHVLYSLFQRTKSSGPFVTFGTMVSSMYHSEFGWFHTSNGIGAHASHEIYKAETEKLREFTTEVLEQELVWGNKGPEE